MKVVFTSILQFLLISAAVHSQDICVLHPQDTGQALVNPGMGWTMHFYSNVPNNYGSKLSPADTLDDFPGLSVVYLRIPWAYVEPQEGEYNWAILDTPAQRWIAKGKRIALRLTCSENWMRFATPKWVKDAGAKGTFYTYGKGPDTEGEAWDPYFDDPVFLEKLDKFLAAVSARYDDNPRVDFIDIGTFGLWGEGHTHASSQQDNIEIQKLHIDLHLKHFKKTLLCISDDYAGHDKPGKRFLITDYALSKGITVRDDSIMVQPPPRSWYHSEMAQAFWPTLPVILEHEHYGGSKNRNAWAPNLWIKAVEDYHASYMSIHWWPRILLNENREMINKINMRMGYRLMPVEINWPKSVTVGQPFKVKWTWANKGVAPCYPGGYPAVTLKDADGGIVSVLTDETLNMRDLNVGPVDCIPETQHESTFTVGQIAPTTNPGKVDVYISVGKRDGTPTIALPLSDDDGQHRYKIGTLTVEISLKQ